MQESRLEYYVAKYPRCWSEQMKNIVQRLDWCIKDNEHYSVPMRHCCRPFIMDIIERSTNFLEFAGQLRKHGVIDYSISPCQNQDESTKWETLYDIVFKKQATAELILAWELSYNSHLLRILDAQMPAPSLLLLFENILKPSDNELTDCAEAFTSNLRQTEVRQAILVCISKYALSGRIHYLDGVIKEARRVKQALEAYNHLDVLFCENGNWTKKNEYLEDPINGSPDALDPLQRRLIIIMSSCDGEMRNIYWYHRQEVVDFYDEILPRFKSQGSTTDFILRVKDVSNNLANGITKKFTISGKLRAEI